MGTVGKIGNFVNREIKNYCNQKAKEKRQEEKRQERKERRK